MFIVDVIVYMLAPYCKVEFSVNICCVYVVSVNQHYLVFVLSFSLKVYIHVSTYVTCFYQYVVFHSFPVLSSYVEMLIALCNTVVVGIAPD